MEGSERSKAPALPPRCPCGFWGSSKTMNLCSKCFADIQKKQSDIECSTKSSPASGSSQSSVYNSDTSSSNSSSSAGQALLTVQKCSEQNSTKQADLTAQEGASHTEPLCTSAKRPCDSDEESVRKKARISPEEQKQKSRRRCFRCQSKLELVQQELGSCRCGYVFCMRHRLPEQHDCVFDHQGRGRQEAVRKMVKLERKVGRSCQRIGEECS
ncbi:AN1-type zinc finger protein 3-like isoform X1 [Colossoma macropomum]|uniref:AN1-type zinc finger protein 3-like isoform X1 n=2 Tax=Colossoma macropomum TaxID=42526 RepID=UPI001864493C|nr:AN1-type zinc finger protein 3-like isoform X1 [Colossoma macropomum]